MKTVSTIAIALVLAASTTTAFAQSVYQGLSSNNDEMSSMTLSPIDAITQASSFNIIKVSAAEATSLGFRTDITSARTRLAESAYAVSTLGNAGLTVDNVVGVRSSDINTVTLFVLS